MGAVCPSALLGCLVDLNVGDDKVGDLETLGVGIGLSVAEETKEELSRLLGPTSAGNTELLSYVNPHQRTPIISKLNLHSSRGYRFGENFETQNPFNTALP